MAETENSPTIANLSYSPSAVQQSLLGTVSINATVDVSDLGADVTNLRILGSEGTDLTLAPSSLNGIRNGKGKVEFPFSARSLGMHTFTVWATDSAGRSSNRLHGTVEVLPQGRRDHPPSISNLSYSPATAVQDPNNLVTVSYSLDFSDAQGDIVGLRLMGSAGTDLSFDAQAVNGVKSGTGTAAFAVSVKSAGMYNFELWVTDSQGAASNRLYGSFEVLPQEVPNAGKASAN